MELNIQKIKENYITRLVVFSIFLYKGMYNQLTAYNVAVTQFLDAKLGYHIDIILIIDQKDKSELREEVLKELLDNYHSYKIVRIDYSINNVNKSIIIDLNDEERYGNYLYG